MLAKFKKERATISDSMFRALAEIAPDGCMDVLAMDQHGSFLKMLAKSPALVPSGKPTDDDVGRFCWHLAGAIDGNATACLCNRLAFEKPGLSQQLGKTALIARLERSKFDKTADGKGQIMAQEVPANAVRRHGAVAVKTLVKLDPAHQEAWEENRSRLSSIWDSCRELDIPLFNEVLYDPLGMPKSQMAKKLPGALIKMAEDFGAIGTFFKTQVPFLWLADENGKVVKVGDAELIADIARKTDEISPLPILLLSAAVDFEQYMLQFSYAASHIAGPMCGRAYFKEVTSLARSWGDVAFQFRMLAIPRIDAIRKASRQMCQPWWAKMELSDAARKLIKPAEMSAGPDIKVEGGY